VTQSVDQPERVIQAEAARAKPYIVSTTPISAPWHRSGSLACGASKPSDGLCHEGREQESVMHAYNPDLAPQPAGANLAARREGARDEYARRRQEHLLDEALKETFPASDPVSVARVT
jgi:hypothetical protein